MKVEILYFDGCPSWQEALKNTRAALGDAQHIDLVQIDTPEQAQAEHFAGSPTIRVDGRDLFPIDNAEYTLACRVYVTPDGIGGAPTVEMMQAGLDKATR